MNKLTIPFYFNSLLFLLMFAWVVICVVITFSLASFYEETGAADLKWQESEDQYYIDSIQEVIISLLSLSVSCILLPLDETTI